MAKFLNTRKAISEIEDLIKNAGEKLILVSPYLKLSKDFKEYLSFRNNNDKITTVIFGKQELKPDEMKFLQSLRFVVLRYNEDLHAKCYLNDEKMVITSLNLYEFSVANNKEMGVLIDKCDPADTQLFEDAYKEVDYIIKTSQKFELNSPITIPNIKKANENNHKSSSNNQTGYCIRTGAPIPFDIEKPLSYDAYKVWVQYGEVNFPENYCLFSGEKSNGATSVGKPILNKNWKKAKEIFNF